MCVGLAALIVGACFVVTPRLRATEFARSAEAASAETALPQACSSLLQEERCWLRSVGNDEARVDLAIGDERASYERWHRSAEACRTEAQFESIVFAETGCVRAADNAPPLPAAHRVDCPEGMFFFTRQDGHVSGCHPTCTVSDDCDEGSQCSSIGSAPGGPVLEPFCE
jgi:hypothetical protein